MADVSSTKNVGSNIQKSAKNKDNLALKNIMRKAVNKTASHSIPMVVGILFEQKSAQDWIVVFTI